MYYEIGKSYLITGIIIEHKKWIHPNNDNETKVLGQILNSNLDTNLHLFEKLEILESETDLKTEWENVDLNNQEWEHIQEYLQEEGVDWLILTGWVKEQKNNSILLTNSTLLKR
jgi:hypothetical protein